jgi:1,2-diacylglycerol 3-alpha-glucosyltransferase
MKIAFFCDTYVPTKNGIATSASTTANELRKRGHRVVIFAPRFTGYEDTDPDVIRFAAGHWFKAKDFPVAWPFASRVAPKAAMQFRREKFDVVHVHSPFVMGGIGKSWARFHFIPLVWTFHTLYHHYAHYSITPPRASRMYIVWRIRQMIEKCDRVIAPSFAIERVIQKLHPNAPTYVLPTGVDVDKFKGGQRHPLRENLGLDPQETLLLYVGRLAPEKNLAFLLRSVAPILKNHRARLLMVGGGPDLELCRELARKLGVFEKVIFPGFIEPKQIPDYYAASDIFTFASRTETQGLSISEALCAGLPSVVVNAMGAAEAIEPNGDGFLVPPTEARFREAVLQLVESRELRQQFSQRALERSPQFSIEKRVTQLIDLYKNIVSENSERNEESRFELI